MSVKVAVIDDYEIVVSGVASMLQPYREQVDIVELDANVHPSQPVDIALYDTFGQGQVHHADLVPLMRDPRIADVVIYTWNFDAHLLAAARSRGVAGYLSKSLAGEDLADALVRIHEGQFIASEPTVRREPSGDWPGRSLGLTERESEVLALITQGHPTRDIADMMYLSPNSVKTHTKSLYRKLDVHSRTEAVLWGIAHGFRPDRYRERDPQP
jgi:DNA-binding NarL/FixJ family response regulator